MWNSRAKHKHWVQRERPKRDVLEIGQLNNVNQSLVARQKIVFPPLHIKLGLMKQFVKVLNKGMIVFSTSVNIFQVLVRKN